MEDDHRDPWTDEKVERAMLTPDCPSCGARWAGGDPRTQALLPDGGSSPSGKWRCGDCGTWFTWP